MTHRQLVLIRQFFDEARRAPATDTPFLLMKSLLGLDLCVELAFNVLIHDHGGAQEQAEQASNKTSWQRLRDIADQVAKAKVGKSIPNLGQLTSLHQVRNLAQHHGVAPHMQDLRGFIEPVRAMLDTLCRDAYGVDFERLREWDALENDALKEWFADCAEAIEVGAPFVAIVGAKVAYRFMIRCVRESAAPPFPTVSSLGLSGVSLPPQVRSAVDKLDEALVDQQAGVIAVSLGFSMADHYRFLRSGAGVQVMQMLAGNIDVWHTGTFQAPREAEEAAFMLDYLGRAALYLENAFPGVFQGKSLKTKLRQERIWSLVTKSARPDPNEGATPP